MSTPAPRYVCPRCRASFDTPLRFCQQCGADMQHASALELAARREGVSEPDLAAVAERARAGSEGERAPSDIAWASASDRRVSASAQTWLGRIVDGRYRVIEVVGRGGMGVVYKVEHVRMGKIAAMKVLHKDLAEDAEVVRRFEREATAVSRLDHPNTVQVFDFGASLGALYLIMEYVRGQDLGHIVDRDGPLPFARAAPLLIQVCGALGEAHELGIVHRDLKPENILITRTTGGRDFAKVLDFGLAKIAREQVPETTDKTEIVGTPYFMSPEQIRGDDVDHRSDIYSLGALMYTVLVGRPPFTAKSAVGVLTKHLTTEPEPPSQVSPEAGLTAEIDAVVLRALAKDPAARWATIADLAAAIETVYTEQVGDLSPTRLPRARGRMSTSFYGEADEPLSELRLRRADLDEYERSLRRRRFGVTATAVVLGAGVAAALAYWLWLREPPLATAEVEPNNALGEATRVAPGEVSGLLGKRLSRTEPDRDYYRVVAPAGAHVVSARLSGLPNADMWLEIGDASGRVVARADEGGAAVGEVLHRWRLDGPVVVAVGEVMRPGQGFPTENVSDRYTLQLAIDAEDAGWESEPNGNAPDATPVQPASAMRGWLEARDDIDLLRWEGEAGRVSIEVRAEGELPVVWRGPDGAAHQGAAEITLERGAIVRIERRDRQASRERPLPGVEAPWTATITPMK